MPPSQHIGRYELLGVLGRGATGRVYHAWDCKLEREVALKLVVKGADEKSRERFHREVCAIAALRHPNIVEIFDYSGPESPQLYYVMERLDGDDLFNLIHAHGLIPEPAAAAIGHELCLALAFMHEAGVIHRDLKPENVYLSAHGRVVLTDFGIVKAVREDSAVEGFDDKTDIVGTPGFMPPELLAGKALGPFTDVFSLGACLYNIVTNELPFSVGSPLELHDSIQSGAVTDLRDHNPQGSEALWECLQQCLAARPKERPTIEDVREQLKFVLDAYGVSDIRDELATYIRNPGVYGESARQRAARRLATELAAAMTVHDDVHAEKLRQQLLEVDPDGSESRAVARDLEVTPLRVTAFKKRPKGHRLVVVTGILVALVLSILVLLATGELRSLVAQLLGASVMPAHSLGTPTGDDALAAAGFLDVRVNGPAAISVSGERLSAQDLRARPLTPGRYRVDVESAHTHLALDVDVIAGQHVLVSADLKRGRIRVE